MDSSPLQPPESKPPELSDSAKGGNQPRQLPAKNPSMFVRLWRRKEVIPKNDLDFVHKVIGITVGASVIVGGLGTAAHLVTKNLSRVEVNPTTAPRPSPTSNPTTGTSKHPATMQSTSPIVQTWSVVVVVHGRNTSAEKLLESIATNVRTLGGKVDSASSVCEEHHDEVQDRAVYYPRLGMTDARIRAGELRDVVRVSAKSLGIDLSKQSSELDIKLLSHDQGMYKIDIYLVD